MLVFEKRHAHEDEGMPPVEAMHQLSTAWQASSGTRRVGGIGFLDCGTDHSGQDVVNHFTRDVGQAEIATCKLVG